MINLEKAKHIAKKRKCALLGDLDFHATREAQYQSTLIKDLNTMHKEIQDSQGILDFYKAKGYRTPSL